MSLKIDKTEREALDAFAHAYGGSTHLGRSIWAGIKAALGLEFREEGREGLPAGLYMNRDDGACVRVPDGSKWLDLSDSDAPSLDLDRLCLLVAAARRLPSLEKLARELGKDLRAWKDAFAPRSNTASIGETNALLSRLRELLPGERA